MPSPRTCSLPLTAPGFSHPAAFSLVEVTIALGIVSFALISVLGMMPVGLSSMRAAMDQTTEAQISRRIAGEMMLTPFSRLDAWVSNSPLYFDDQGGLQPTRDQETRYTVALRRSATVFPGSSNAVNLSSNMATFALEIARGPGPAVSERSTNVIHIPNSGD